MSFLVQSGRRPLAGLWTAGQASRVPRRLVVAALPIAAFTSIALLGPLILSYDHVHTSLTDRLRPPLSTVSWGTAILGTDQVGRDILGQVVHGATVSLTVGFVTVVIAGLVGSLLGIAAAVAGGWLDSAVMRAADIQLSLPAFLLAILMAGVIGPSVLNVILTLALTRWVMFARVARGSALSAKGRDFVDSARVLGASRVRLVRRHIAPACVAPLVVVATTQFGLVVVAEASLSFLGLGTPISVPSWGQTIANGRDYLATAWWISTIPGLVLAMVTISFAVLGDSLRDHLDPHMKVR